MTPDDARNYFFQNLNQVRNTSDLLRLTLWTVPYLTAASNRPLGRIETMAFRLQLEHSKYDEKTRVWYSSNRDISTQLGQLEPMYTKGSSGPHFCSGLSPRMLVPGGPNFSGPGLSLGPFAREHAAAKKKLDAATSVQAWWKVFLGQTPLWMRTAYNWYKPTSEQKDVLKVARKAMLAYVPALAGCTKESYSQTGGAHFAFMRPFADEGERLAKAPHWNALVAGQQFVHINDVKDTSIEIQGLTQAMPGVKQAIENLCAVVCELRGWKDMGDVHIRRAFEQAEKREKVMRLEQRDGPVDISYLETPTPP